MKRNQNGTKKLTNMIPGGGLNDHFLCLKNMQSFKKRNTGKMYQRTGWKKEKNCQKVETVKEVSELLKSNPCVCACVCLTGE